MKAYPVKLKPILKQAVWGGSKLPQFFGLGTPGQTVAEAWMLAERPDGQCRIANGGYAGHTLAEFVSACGTQQVYGTVSDAFPLLIKLIDAKDALSVQVHPDDAYARTHGLDAGKTEMWYIAEADDNAELVYGLAENAPPNDALAIAAKDGTLENYLHRVKVKAGEVYFIPAGLVHAIGGGILIAEIQQNANTTYRFYDYNRKDATGKLRELHVDKAVEVTKRINTAAVSHTPSPAPTPYGSMATLCECEFFKVEKHAFLQQGTLPLNDHRMHHILVLQGTGILQSDTLTLTLSKGESVLIPASCQTVLESCDMTVIDSYLP